MGRKIKAAAIQEVTSQPQTAQPKINVAPEMYQLSDEIIPAMMIPHCKRGLRLHQEAFPENL